MITNGGATKAGFDAIFIRMISFHGKLFRIVPQKLNHKEEGIYDPDCIATIDRLLPRSVEGSCLD